jgi:hypothetical protein
MNKRAAGGRRPAVVGAGFSDPDRRPAYPSGSLADLD